MSQALIVCDIDAHGVATLRLNRPEKANGFNIPMIGQCSAAIEALANDDAVKVIVITGTGRFFCAGGDIDELFDVVESGAVRAKAYLWAQNGEHNWLNRKNGAASPAIVGAKTVLHGLPDGAYTCTWWDTWKGEKGKQEKLTAQGSALTLPLPELATDVAAALEPAP